MAKESWTFFWPRKVYWEFFCLSTLSIFINWTFLPNDLFVKVLENGDARPSYKAHCLRLGEEIQAKDSNFKSCPGIRKHVYTTHRYNTWMFWISSAHYKGYTRKCSKYFCWLDWNKNCHQLYIHIIIQASPLPDFFFFPVDDIWLYLWSNAIWMATIISRKKSKTPWPSIMWLGHSHNSSHFSFSITLWQSINTQCLYK